MNPLAKTVRNTEMAILEIAGSCARRLAKSLTCVLLLLAAAAATADKAPVPTQIVDLANKVDGVHPGFRAFHAKGVVVEGSFKPSPEAARLSSALLFNGRSIPVTARFSDGSGMPTVPDGSPAIPRHRDQVPPGQRTGHRHGHQLIQVFPSRDRRGLS